MTATSPAPHTPAAWPRARGWGVLLPARTPDHLRAAPRPIPGWAAYTAYNLGYSCLVLAAATQLPA